MSAYVMELTIEPTSPGAAPFDAPIPDENGNSTDKYVRVTIPPTCTVRVVFHVTDKVDPVELAEAIQSYIAARPFHE